MKFLRTCIFKNLFRKSITYKKKNYLKGTEPVILY